MSGSQEIRLVIGKAVEQPFRRLREDLQGMLEIGTLRQFRDRQRPVDPILCPGTITPIVQANRDHPLHGQCQPTGEAVQLADRVSGSLCPRASSPPSSVYGAHGSHPAARYAGAGRTGCRLR